MCDRSQIKMNQIESLIVDFGDEDCSSSSVGGKAYNLWKLGRSLLEQCRVPPWFCLTAEAFQLFLQDNDLLESLHVNPRDLKTSTSRIREVLMGGAFPSALEAQIRERLSAPPFEGAVVAVRSSGTDEDSAAHSFAGQFESYLFQRGADMVLAAVKKCWCSCFSERVMSHRLDCGMPVTGLKMAVVVQVMVNSEVSGVGFSRHPLKPLSSDHVLVEAVYGLGEGLVSGALEADRYEVSRSDLSVTSELADKSEKFVRCEEGGVKKVTVEEGQRGVAALTEREAVSMAQLLVSLEEEMGRPQDFEWGMEGGQLYCLQTRPIVTLLPTCFFDYSAPGGVATLWDNSNIVESYSGVTSPLTFSFASYAYERVYTLTLRAASVPPSVVAQLKPYLSNMLGLLRGNIYYNLMSWYRCLASVPMGDTSKYMETMMGVKQTLDPDLEAQLGEINKTAPKYSIWIKMKLLLGIAHKIYYMDQLVATFFSRFNQYYTAARETDFNQLSLQKQVEYVKFLYEEAFGKWEVPIYNDTYVMLFFGLLKRLVTKWMAQDPQQAQTLQNDLLCGQGDVESTEPTKSLMRIAEYIDTHEKREGLRAWFLESREEVMDMLSVEGGRVARERGRTGSPATGSGLRRRKVTTDNKSSTETPPQQTDPLYQAKLNTVQAIQRFLSKYGFRCINELKLEEQTLYDDPTFILDIIAGYVKTASYSIQSMEARERTIRDKAEGVVNSTLPIHKRWFFNKILYHARRGVKHRENMRFARTKLFGVFRDLFRAIGNNLVQLGLLKTRQDVFYLTVEEIFAYVEGRSVTNNLAGLVELRRTEYDGYRKGLAPPERLMTRGAVGPYLLFPQLLEDLDLLKSLEAEASMDPNVLTGTPCCPGLVEGVVRVVTSVEETSGLNGEILVTARTDPGWVPLFPLCSGLVIERGSLLSHSAVVARELGLPTIVGVSGGLMKRLKSGMRVQLDAGKGRVTILRQEDSQTGQAEREE